MYILKNKGSKYMKLKPIDLKRRINSSTIVAGDFDTPSQKPIKLIEWKSKKDIDLNRTINEQDLIDIFWTLHPATAEYTILF